MSYQDKYLKYKTKYLNLKKIYTQQGGHNMIDIETTYTIELDNKNIGSIEFYEPFNLNKHNLKQNIDCSHFDIIKQISGKIINNVTLNGNTINILTQQIPLTTLPTNQLPTKSISIEPVATKSISTEPAPPKIKLKASAVIFKTYEQKQYEQQQYEQQQYEQQHCEELQDEQQQYEQQQYEQQQCEELKDEQLHCEELKDEQQCEALQQKNYEQQQCEVIKHWNSLTPEEHQCENIKEIQVYKHNIEEYIKSMNGYEPEFNFIQFTDILYKNYINGYINDSVAIHGIYVVIRWIPKEYKYFDYLFKIKKIIDDIKSDEPDYDLIMQTIHSNLGADSIIELQDEDSPDWIDFYIKIIELINLLSLKNKHSEIINYLKEKATRLFTEEMHYYGDDQSLNVGNDVIYTYKPDKIFHGRIIEISKKGNIKLRFYNDTKQLLPEYIFKQPIPEALKQYLVFKQIPKSDYSIFSNHIQPQYISK